MNSELIQIFIDGNEVSVPSDYTVMQACLNSGVEIPRFCYHDKLSIAGNCRMCLVEVEKSAKLVASCAMPLMKNMKIITNSSIVKKAREGVLEFLLINHPLDCPICDQGGECDLQDQAMVYGSDRGRFHEFKRSVKDKQVGPLIKTIMTRCIHCTRCVRFTREVAGIRELGTTGRGGNMEITTYVKKLWLDSYLSGNVIDLCPVGALTSKPYAFKTRPWELKHTESIDILDSFGSNIRVDATVVEVLRILPRVNESVNGEWITDKTRFSYDGLKKQRITHPMLKDEKYKNFYSISWKESFLTLQKWIETSKNQEGLLGNLIDLESSWAFKLLFQYLGSPNIKNASNSLKFKSDFRNQYILGNKLNSFKKNDCYLSIGANLEVDAPLMLQRLNSRASFFQFGDYSQKGNLNLNIHIGSNLSTLLSILEGKSFISRSLLKSKSPSIFVGENMFAASLSKFTSSQILKLQQELGLDQNLNIIHTSSSQIGNLEIGVVPGSNSSFARKGARNSPTDSLLYLLGFDEKTKIDELKNSNYKYIVYHGHHGDSGAAVADLILPGAVYTEKNGSYLSLEGLYQQTKKVILPPEQAVNEATALVAFIYYIIKKEYFNVKTLTNSQSEQIEGFLKNSLGNQFSFFKNYSNLNTNVSLFTSESKVVEKENIVTTSFIRPSLENYYESNVISRASEVMAKCSMLKTSQNIFNFI